MRIFDTDDSPIGPEQPVRIYNATSLGVAISELRRRRGMTQEQLAEALGISQSYVSTLEQGHANKQLERIIAALRILDARLVVQPGAPW
jgi:UDP-N-acetylglucosamine 1-carboxyvinyltransferase